MKTNLEKIKEVLDLEAWRKKQKTLFRKRILSTVLAILLIGAVIYMFWNGYV
tara:strand:- start:44 stop:199 length:156 start_codon:yes stop_codon:yes gene_type:complete